MTFLVIKSPSNKVEVVFYNANNKSTTTASLTQGAALYHEHTDEKCGRLSPSVITDLQQDVENYVANETGGSTYYFNQQDVPILMPNALYEFVQYQYFWKIYSPLSIPEILDGAARCGSITFNALYFFGGISPTQNATIKTNSYVYRLATKSGEALQANLLQARCFSASTRQMFINESTYIFGGRSIVTGANNTQTIAPVASIERFNVTQGAFEAVQTQMPTSRSHHALCGNSQAVVVGGMSSMTQVESSGWFLNNFLNFSGISNAPSALYGQACYNATQDTTNYQFVGGYNSSNAPVTANFAYSRNNNSWSSRSSLPVAKAGHVMFGLQSVDFIVACGRETNGMGLGVYYYNSSLNVWSTLQNSLVPRHNAFAVGYTTMSIVVGGDCDSNGALLPNQTIEAFVLYQGVLGLFVGKTLISLDTTLTPSVLSANPLYCGKTVVVATTSKSQSTHALLEVMQPQLTAATSQLNTSDALLRPHQYNYAPYFNNADIFSTPKESGYIFTSGQSLNVARYGHGLFGSPYSALIVGGLTATVDASNNRGLHGFEQGCETYNGVAWTASQTQLPVRLALFAQAGSLLRHRIIGGLTIGQNNQQQVLQAIHEFNGQTYSVVSFNLPERIYGATAAGGQASSLVIGGFRDFEQSANPTAATVYIQPTTCAMHFAAFPTNISFAHLSGSPVAAFAYGGGNQRNSNKFVRLPTNIFTNVWRFNSINWHQIGNMAEERAFGAYVAHEYGCVIFDGLRNASTNSRTSLLYNSLYLDTFQLLSSNFTEYPRGSRRLETVAGSRAVGNLTQGLITGGNDSLDTNLPPTPSIATTTNYWSFFALLYLNNVFVPK